MPAMPRGTTAALGAVVLLQLFATAAAHAQPAQGGTIADPPVVFTRPVACFDGTPAARFTGVSAHPMENQLFEMGWWYRIGADEAETFLPVPTGELYIGDTSTITWDDLGGFRAVEKAVVVDGGGPSGQVVFTLTFTNLSSTTPLSINVFNMTDVDLGGTSDGDRAELLNPNDRIRFTDEGGDDVAEYAAAGAEAFLVRPYDGTNMTDVAGELNDADLDDFDDSGVPFGPGDVSAGFQWPTTVIPPSGSATFVAGIAVNMTLTLPSISTTTTSSTILGANTTTSTTLATELCDNCVDDDGDALLDFEDGDCCAPVPLTLGKSRLRPRDAGTATVKLKAKLAASPVADGDAATQDLTLQIRGGGATLCARFPAATLERRRKRLEFRDVDGIVASARGITAVTVKEKKQGAKVAVFGPAAQLAVLGPGPFTVTLGLRDPATAEATNQCAAATATFRPARRGVRYP